MIRLLFANLFRFVLLIALQILLFNRIQVSGYLNPYFYVLFILLLPFETPNWLLLISSFVLGLGVDLFSGTPGMHTMACTLMGFARPFILDTLSPRDGYKANTSPRISFYGLEWFLRYTILLVVIHHFALFYIEVFKWTAFWHTLLRVILSTLFSTFFMVASQFFIFRK